MSVPAQSEYGPKYAPERDFETLLSEHQRRIYFFIRSMVFNPEDASDVLQDVNMVALRKRAHFTPGTDFKSWVFAIARFECLTYLSRNKKVQWAELDSDLLSTLADRAEERADDVEAWLGALAACRQALLAADAELLDSRYWKSVSLASIAGKGGTSIGAVKQKLLRIRAQLKACVLARLRRGGPAPDSPKLP